MSRGRSFGGPWLALTSALAAHVADEATTGFLDLWNPMVERIRAVVPWSPLPTFSFSAWLSGLIAAVAILALLTPVAASGARRLRPLACAYAVLMLVNGIGHLAASAVLARPAPGVVSAPLLLAASIWLLARLAGTRHLDGSGERSPSS